MGNLLIRDMPPVLDSAVRELSARTGISFSEAAKELMRSGVAANSNTSKGDDEKPLLTGDFLVNTFGGGTKESSEEFARILDEVRHMPDRPPFEFE